MVSSALEAAERAVPSIKNRLSAIFNVRNSLIGSLMVLALIAVGLSTNQAIQAWSDAGEATRLVKLNDFDTDLGTLKEALSVERGLSMIALASGDRGGMYADRIDQNRRTAEQAFERVRAGAEELPDFKGKKDTLDALTRAYTTYLGVRSQVDGAIAAGGEPVRRLRQAFGGVIDAGRDLRLNAEHALAGSNAAISAYMRLKFRLWEMKEYAAQEWGSVGANVAANDPISEQERTLNAIRAGRVQGAWDDAASLVSSGLTDDDLTSFIDDVNNEFFEAFRFDVLYAISDESIDVEAGGTYSMSSSEFVAMATAASAPIELLAIEAAERTEALATDNAGTNQGLFVLQVIVLAIVGTIAVATYITVVGRVVLPLASLRGVMERIVDGDLEAEVRGADRHDEIGDMAKAVQVFKDNAREKIHLEEEQKRAEEEQRRTKDEQERQAHEAEEARRQEKEEQERSAREQRQAEMLALADSFEKSVMAVVDGLSSSAGEMERAAQEMAATAEDTSSKSAVVSTAAKQATANVQMVASAAEELSSSVKEISGQTGQSSESARDAVNKTEQASTEIQDLVHAGEKIGDVVQLINDIADQTNLLALNATIEAARAGEAGKGFAVVASEVKSLASQTAKATQEISDQISGMQAATRQAVSAIEAIGKIIKEIDATAVSIASSVEEQDVSTQEIARNVAEVSAGTEEVTSNISAVSEGASSTGAAASQVLGSAQALAQQSTDLKQEVEKFLATIRAA